MNYNNLLTFGDVIELRLNCNVSKLLYNTKQYEWKRYNPRKDIPRYGLSVTSLDGSLNGIDLDSIAEYNKENGTSYNESSFKTFTDAFELCFILTYFNNGFSKTPSCNTLSQTLSKLPFLIIFDFQTLFTVS